MERATEVITKQLKIENTFVGILKSSDKEVNQAIKEKDINYFLFRVKNNHSLNKEEENILKEDLNRIFDLKDIKKYKNILLLPKLKYIANSSKNSPLDVLNDILQSYYVVFIRPYETGDWTCIPTDLDETAMEEFMKTHDNNIYDLKFIIDNIDTLLSMKVEDIERDKYIDEHPEVIDNIQYTKEVYINGPNISKIVNALNQYNEKDVDDGTTQAILTLLNYNHRDEED